MAEAYVGEIRIFPYNFAPSGWAMCNGQLIAISQNTALFSLIGTYYGGNGTSNFALPNLQGAGALSQGQAVTGTNYSIGESAGVPNVTLLTATMPAHTHQMYAATGHGLAPETAPIAGGSVTTSKDGNAYAPAGTTASLHPLALAVVGGGQPHNNLMPYQTFSFCIALQGVFPPRG